ncbi:hypothetical protein SPBR_07305 [Sporothrix brasiliensis 5110]|uniref:Uncharacterized protein n=1 Tax=Sporothrix brasiliensis 5110 TaxID=1398154 RepID=A0A0C2IIJ8_9PEZI|nr:uncharacterized protein SPBR_07305 [Sporothrix brasiliensis 5110]KIH89006.1 hypothetical protein SPBR_07305 [Sporothrix brasiliensis 5110]
MKYSAAVLVAGLGLASAEGDVLRLREVPQEHSHNRFLDLVRASLSTNNPQKIQDPVFGLLGNAAAAAGAGSVTNLDCLQQATADQAFTNAKAAGDIPGMAGALLYRAIERNTGSVGLASVICNETAANPEIQAVSQHQDPASANAATVNKGITLALAKQLAAIGADPLLALESGTFAPGKVGDPTAAGNTCDTENDEPGCIFSENLLVLDASEAEISSAVAGITPTITGTGVIRATDIDLAKLAVATGAAGAAGATAAAGTAAASSEAACAGTTRTVIATVTAAAATAAGPSCSTVVSTVAAAEASALVGKRQSPLRRSRPQRRAALDFGSCGAPTILFESGLDGRNTEAFIAEDQTDFNHGSALNIAVIAGFICQRLGSSCNAAADAQASCTAASAAAVATTQNQAAADAFNNALGLGSGVTAAAGNAASATASSVVVTVTKCS